MLSFLEYFLVYHWNFYRVDLGYWYDKVYHVGLEVWTLLFAFVESSHDLSRFHYIFCEYRFSLYLMGDNSSGCIWCLLMVF